ncbi:MAG: helix-turn-helix domain-containing protein [Dehalococcoidia bacterium]
MTQQFEEVLEEQLEDPEFREHWQRTALARAVAMSSIRYRGEHGLSQKQLAELAGWKQPQVARLELGEHNPTIDTLVHLSRILGVEYLVDIRPAANHRRSWVTPEAEDAGVVERFTTQEGGHVLVAAG